MSSTKQRQGSMVTKPTQHQPGQKPRKGPRSKFLRVLGGLTALLAGVTGLGVACWMGLVGKPLNPFTLDQPLTILVLGIDGSGASNASQAQTREQAFAGNSDTILLVRIVPDTHQISVLSIPRDTLVQLPGEEIDKANDANLQGGAPLAVKTVSYLLGDIPIDRYIRVDTSGLIQLVDALGGLEITIPKRMDYVDHTQNLTIHFLPGKQTLNGQHLQEYVRFRHDELGDIGRVQRQQAVLKALLHRLKQPSILLKLPHLLGVVGKMVDSNLSSQERLRVSQFLATLDRQNINLVMLPGRFSRSDEYAASYWIADPQAAVPILERYFGTQNTTTTAGSFRENAQLRIAVVNDTNRAEAGDRVLTLLKQAGFTNSYLAELDSPATSIPLAETRIIAQHGNPEDAKAVLQVLGLGQVAVESTGNLEADLTVRVGIDLLPRLH